MNIVLYSAKHDEIVLLDPCPENLSTGVGIEANSGMMLLITESYLKHAGFNNLSDWILLGVEIKPMEEQ